MRAPANVFAPAYPIRVAVDGGRSQLRLVLGEASVVLGIYDTVEAGDVAERMLYDALAEIGDPLDPGDR